MMKRIFLMLCAAGLTTLSFAQGTKWDSTYRPNNYQVKVDQFRQLPNDAEDIYFLGNSITAGVDWNELLGVSNIRNRGISGDISFGVLERLDEVIEGKPAKLFLLIGVNDISRNIPDSIIVANYRNIVRRVKAGSPRTRLYLQTILPVNNQFTQFKNHYNKDGHIHFVNDAIKKIAKEFNAVVIDLHAHFLDKDGRLVKQYTHDGLHLTIEGYHHWASLLKSGGYIQGNMSPAFPAFSKEGHRGSRGLMPENTIPAMEKAIDCGVTTLEMDVVISKDRKVVVSHDPYFNADITITPEGKQLTKSEASARVLYGMDYDSIRRYDVGSKLHPGFPQQQKMPVHKPLLSSLIRAAESYTKENGTGQMWYNIETKTSAGGDGVKHPAPEEFVDLLVALLKAEGILSRTVIQSFDIRTLKVLNRKYPSIKTSLLINANDSRSLKKQIDELGFLPFVYSPHFKLVTTSLVRDCHEKGIKVVPWTVNTKADIEAMKVLQVDGIISDYPNLF